MKGSIFGRARNVRVLIYLILIGAGLASAVGVDASTPPRKAESPAGALFFAPEEGFDQTTREVFRQLTRQHYQRIIADDNLSEKIFSRYLKDLDPTHSLFLAADIAEFDVFRHQLDDAVKRGNLAPAYTIFNRYQTRLEERLSWIVERITKGRTDMDFSVNETVLLDREEAPWPQNRNEQDEIWRKRLKNEALNLKLAGKSKAEIRDLLAKRYQNRLHRARQTNNEDVLRIYLNAVTQSYDPHSQYFPPRMSEDFDIRMRLSLEGIGAVLQTENEYTKVVSLVPAGPAAKSKLIRPGDRIIGVGQGENGEIVDVVGWRIDDVVQLIRGPKETVVQLRILPGGSTDEQKARLIRITRNTVKLEEQAAKKRVLDLSYQGKTRRIGVIDIPTFYVDFKAYQRGDEDYRSTTRDVERFLTELMAEKVDGIVIDLRDNGGGALQEASSLVGLFIPEGPTVQVRNTGGRISELRDRDPAVVYDGPLAVLVNRLSASASEIFAGAIQDYGRGIIIGSRTFGKGTVQSLVDLEQGQLKLTVAKFYRISGESTQSRGVIPDILLPDLFDTEKIGEHTLPEALPWDIITPSSYRGEVNFSQLKDTLTHRHEERIRHTPEFSLLVSEIEHRKALQERTQISLQEEKRKKEQEALDRWQLEIENKRRKLQGLPPLSQLPAGTDPLVEEEELVPPEEEEEDQGPDPFLTESGFILLDAISLSPPGMTASSSP